MELVAVERPEGDAHALAGDRVDVSTQRRTSQLMCLAYRSPTSHERVEHADVGEILLPVELLLQARILWQDAPKEDATKDRAKSLGPPLVNVIDRAIDLLTPALALGESRHKVESGLVGLDQPALARFENRIIAGHHVSLLALEVQGLAAWQLVHGSHP